jgi:hypothetical protein
VANARSHAVCSKITRAHAFEVDALIKAIFARRLFAREKFLQLARDASW